MWRKMLRSMYLRRTKNSYQQCPVFQIWRAVELQLLLDRYGIWPSAAPVPFALREHHATPGRRTQTRSIATGGTGFHLCCGHRAAQPAQCVNLIFRNLKDKQGLDLRFLPKLPGLAHEYFYLPWGIPRCSGL